MRKVQNSSPDNFIYGLGYQILHKTETAFEESVFTKICFDTIYSLQITETRKSLEKYLIGERSRLR